MNGFNRRWVAAFLLLSMCFLSAIFAVQGALLSAMIDAFALTSASQGAANASAFAGGICALTLAFLLQGRWKKRALLKAAMALCSVGLASLCFAPTYGAFTAIWFPLGFGLGLMDALLSACMADLYTGDEATRMMCLLHTAFGLSSVLSPMGFAALLAGGMPWKRVYLLIAACGAALILGAAALRRALSIPDPEVLRRERFSLKQTAADMSGSGLTPLCVGLFFHGIFLSGLNTWINRYAELLPGGVAVPAQSCLFLGIMLSRLLFPFLSIDVSRYVKAGGLLGCAALAIGLFAGGGVALRVALVFVGLAIGAMIPCVLTLGCGQMRGNTLLASTALNLALYLGQAVSSPTIAALEARFGLRVGICLCAVCMAACSLSCALGRGPRAAER